jgi:hypothetical protein
MNIIQILKNLKAKLIISHASAMKIFGNFKWTQENLKKNWSSGAHSLWLDFFSFSYFRQL